MASQKRSLDSFHCRRTLAVGGRNYVYFDLREAEKNGLAGLSQLPVSLKVLVENLLRFEDGGTVKAEDIRAFAEWLKEQRSTHEIAFRPARVLMQDFTGVPAVVDLAAMRDAMAKMGGDPKQINPLVPVDLVIDHSVMVDYFGTADAFGKNVAREYERNRERYEFLRWGSRAFANFRVVPPGTGICHQVNLEYLARGVWTLEADGETYAYPDTLVGTDSHTTMVNGLSVLGWGVGGIEAEAAMLGQPVSMLIPEVVGVRLDGRLKEGVTATDLVLTVTQMLRKHGVVGKFVEYCGEGLDHLSLEDQATLANMAPEYGATCGFFPVDGDTIDYLKSTGRAEAAALTEAYAKAQGLWRDNAQEPVFTDLLTLDLASVEPSLAGPKRPQDRVALSGAKAAFEQSVTAARATGKDPAPAAPLHEGTVEGADYVLRDGHVMIAAITSCTNTSNPSVLIAAGLLAQKAHARGLKAKPWVKTSLAPGSQVVTDYLTEAGLMGDLEALGFNLVGYGCTTCIGNSGPLDEPLAKAIHAHDLIACSVLSGNRNFEGRIGPDIKANFLASPPLVVAYAIAGSLLVDLTSEPLGTDRDGKKVYLKDIWPSNREVADLMRRSVSAAMFDKRYGNVFAGDANWQQVEAPQGETYDWDIGSTYVQNPPYFTDMTMQPAPVEDIYHARVLALFKDSITTDHISPAGSIKEKSPAGQYLIAHQVAARDFNSYGARRGNHEVMMRGTFANIRIRNLLLPGSEGGVTRHSPSGDQMSIYDAAMRYLAEGTPLVVIAGKEYGTGSSRDWAAKGTRLLGVRAVVAESFERIHRSNLIGMGVLPLVFQEGQSRESLGLTGFEMVDIEGLDKLTPRSTIEAGFIAPDGTQKNIPLLVRIDTEDELTYFRHGGILHYVLRQLAGVA